MLTAATCSVLAMHLLCNPGWTNEADSDMSPQTLRATLSKTEIDNLGLRQVLEIAQEENRIHKAAVAEVGVAKAKYQTAMAQFLPNLIMLRPFNHYQGGIQTITGGILPANMNSTQPQMAFQFVFSGRQLLATRVAGKQLQAQQHTEQAVLQDTLRQTALEYYELQRRLADVMVAREQVARCQANLELNQARLASGSGTRLDVLQSQNQLLEAQDQLVEAMRDAEMAALCLNNRLNLPAVVQVVPNSEKLEVHTLIPHESDFGSLLTRANTTNPRLKALQSQLATYTQLFKPSSLAMAVIPNLMAQVRTGRTITSTGQTGSFTDVSYAVGLSLDNLTVSQLTQFMGVRAQIEQAKALLESQRKQVEQEISQAWVDAKTRQAQIDIAEQKLACAEATYLDAMGALKSGTGRNLDLMAAQTTLTEAHKNLNSRITTYNKSQVNLVYELGLASTDTLANGLNIQ